ncbi:hypothetical protein V8B97DRAFT_1221494 [Scleroderma yunnanense]
MRSCTFSMTVELPCGGSLAWMAPELLKGNDASVTSDIRAFAMIALELFTRLLKSRIRPALRSGYCKGHRIGPPTSECVPT